jgi:hypothetical protein
VPAAISRVSSETSKASISPSIFSSPMVMFALILLFMSGSVRARILAQ